MKKSTFTSIILLISLLVFISNVTNAQTGSTCNDPHIITSLPFTQVGMTTDGFGDNYSQLDACGSAWLEGNDYVFEFTPPVCMNISITLSNTGMGAGLFLLEGCPDDTASKCMQFVEEVSAPPSIASAALEGGLTYYILVSTADNTVFPIPSTPFDIDIQQLPGIPYNGGISKISSVPSSCGLAANEQIYAVITNYGSDTLYSFDVAYQIDGGTAVIEQYSGMIPPCGYDVYTFMATADFSATGTYEIKAYTIIPNDTIAIDDTTTDNITNNITVSTYPYLEDFESGSGNWIQEGINSSWEYGTPSATLINSAASGNKCWATNLSGNYNDNEASTLIGPCFDLSSLSNPVFEMKIWYEMVPAYATLQSSVDNGWTWQDVGAGETSPEWYNNSLGANTGWTGQIDGGTWKTVIHALDGLAGNSKVMLRVNFNGKIVGLPGTVEEGLAVDDIQIHESAGTDMGVVLLLAPESSCSLSDSTLVGVRLANNGNTNITSFEVAYSVDGSPYVTDSVYASISSGSTYNYTFNTAADFSASGIHELIVKVIYPNDEIAGNDSLISEIINFPVYSAVGYFEDFESGAGGWYESGSNPSWELGSPAGTIIDHASSGASAWVTNLSGNHNTNEVSYVTSPCLDLTGIAAPFISADIWIETGSFSNQSGLTSIEVSIGGGNWLTLGMVGDPVSWYDSTGFQSWAGNSGGWITAKHYLTNCENQAKVQVRFAFQDLIGTSEGFAFDNIKISECDALQASFTQSANYGSLSFTNTSTNADAASWDFGDGTTSEELNPNHTYADNGSYTVSLIAMNGCTNDTITALLDITVCDSVSADFSAVPDFGLVDFTSSDTMASSYSWDFGDGNYSNQQNPTNIYAASGDYTVTLISSNDCSADTISQLLSITVCDSVNVDFTADIIGNTVSFTTSGDNAMSYIWDFGDGDNSTAQNPTHLYTTDTIFIVTLIAYGNCSIDTVQHTVSTSVFEIDRISFTIAPNPAKNKVIIRSQAISEVFSIELMTLDGKQISMAILNGKAGENEKQLDITSYPRGMYLLKISSEKGTETRKLVFD